MTDQPASPADPAPSPSTSRRRSWADRISVLLLLVALAAGGWVLWTSREAVGDGVATIGAGGLVASLAAATVAVLATAMCWRVWLGALGAAPAPVESAKLFLVTQAGKYLPGSAWPVLAQISLSRRFGIGRAAAVLAATMFLVTHVATGVAIGAATIGVSSVGPLVAVGSLGAVALLLPPVQRGVVTMASRLRRTATIDPVGLTWTRSARASVWMLVAWVALGGSIALLAVPLGATWTDLPVLLGAFALAWVAGFLALPTPAGAGVREVVLVALLAPVLDREAALVVATASRVATVLADLGLAAASVGILTEGERPQA